MKGQFCWLWSSHEKWQQNKFNRPKPAQKVNKFNRPFSRNGKSYTNIEIFSYSSKDN